MGLLPCVAGNILGRPSWLPVPDFALQALLVGAAATGSSKRQPGLIALGWLAGQGLARLLVLALWVLACTLGWVVVMVKRLVVMAMVKRIEVGRLLQGRSLPSVSLCKRHSARSSAVRGLLSSHF